MNIFHKVALQGMKKGRTRTVVTVIGVVLSAAMFTAVATFGTSLLQFLINGSIAKYGNWHVAFEGVDSSFCQEITRDEEVSNTAAFVNLGYAMPEGTKSPEKPYLFLAGFRRETFDTLPISLISGRLPENDGEILVPSHLAIKGGVRYAVGDTITLAVGNRMDGNKILGQHDPYRSGEAAGESKEVFAAEEEKSYTVTGIYERPGFEEHSAPGYTLITKAEAQDAAAGLSVFVTLENPRKVREYAERTAVTGSYVLNDNLLRFMGISENKLFNTILFSVGGILAVIIMTGSVFLIYNSFHISLNERTHQFGILLSVGATAKQLQNSVLFEGLCIGAVGIPVGVLAGIGSIGLVIPVVENNFRSILTSDVPLTLSVSLPVIFAAAAVSLITILISAYIPARKAAGTPVMECIRQTNEIKSEAKTVKTSGLAQRIYGLEGTLALKNFKRNKKRYRSVVLSLVLSVVLFVAGSAFGTTLKRLSQEMMVDIDYDIMFNTREMKEGDVLSLYEKLKKADGVYQSQAQIVYEYSCAVDAVELSERYREYRGYTATDGTVSVPMYLQFIEDSEYLDFLKEMGLSEAEYTGENGEFPVFARQKIDNQGEKTSEVFDVFADDSATFCAAPQTEEGQMTEQGQSVRAAIVDNYSVDLPEISHDTQNSTVFILIVPWSLRDSFEPPDAGAYYSIGFYSKNPLQTVGAMETILQETGMTADYTLYSIYAIMEQFRSLTFVVNVFTYIFVIMISLIAVANVFNTISTNIKLRRRELAMLRSMGMSERSFNRMMHFECAFYGMRTLLYGIPIAGILSWLICEVMKTAEKMDTFRFEFPWGSMTVSILGVFLIVFITMLYAVRRIKKENIIDALRDDMT